MDTINNNQEQQSDVYNEFKITCRNGDYERMSELLNQYNNIDLVNRIDPQTRQISLFLIASVPDDSKALEIIKLLIHHGVNVQFEDALKQTVLFYICRDGKTKCLEQLVSQGLNINKPDIHGQTPLFYASRDNKFECVQKMIQLGADMNVVDNLQNQTPLFYAAREGHLEMCKLLIENGCKPQHQDNTKKNALFFAKKNNRKDVIEYLSQFNGKQQTMISSQRFSKEQESQSIDHKNVQPAVIPQQPVLAQSQSQVSHSNLKRLRSKEVQKQSYKLIYTDEQGNLKELSQQDFEDFRQKYPDIARYLTDPDETITEEMISTIKEEESWEKVAKKALQQIWKVKGAQLFHQPVDPKLYGIDDYYDYVKKPMDFGTIKSRLNTNIYSSCKQFLNDMDQVFINCELYNGLESEVGKLGVSIRKEWEKMVDQNNLKR